MYLWRPLFGLSGPSALWHHTSLWEGGNETWMDEESAVNGVAQAVGGHYKRPVEHAFTKAEREGVTCLFGGLTKHHEKLILAAFEGRGYTGAALPLPTKADCRTGREYCSTGMCNPAYFTIGSLINYLKRLRDVEGVPTDRILRDYVFATAGSSGPCRFGVYESEYRLALKNSGFDGFRVIAFQQMGGVKQSDDEDGLELNLNFALPFLTGIFVGDLLNETACRLRPYEVVPGQTDRCMDKVSRLAQDHMRALKTDCAQGGLTARLLSWLAHDATAGQVQQIMDHVFGTYYVDMLRQYAKLIDAEVEVDYTRPKPICKVTGEFWAQLTEGDGNFNMFSFLESHGADALVEPIMTWANYLFDSAHCRLLYEKGIHDPPAASGFRGAPRRLGHALSHRKNVLMVLAIKKILNREYERMRVALGGVAARQVDPRELRRLAQPYFDYRIAGGEGYLEVAKTIYYSINNLAHVVLSLKPFGCLPSTQSDGAQAAVLAHYPDINFVSVETSGDGDINAYSRVLMALGDAKEKCKQEFESCVRDTGYTLEQIRRFCVERGELRRPLQAIPRRDGVIGKAANFVLYVADLMDTDSGK